MVLWISGRSKSGKSTLAHKISQGKWIVLDGDAMRKSISEDLGFSKEDRWKHNLRVAKLARELDAQGFDVIVATICPYQELRKKVQEITGCKFIFLDGGIKRDNQPYEEPKFQY